jgi:hypothetical protein
VPCGTCGRRGTCRAALTDPCTAAAAAAAAARAQVIDEGGGIKRSDLQHVWSYMFSSAPQPSPHQFKTVTLDHMTVRMHFNMSICTLFYHVS